MNAQPDRKPQPAERDSSAALPRLTIAETQLPGSALQLLPGVKRKLELNERACRWQHSFAAAELQHDTVSLVAFSGSVSEKNIDLLLQSAACQSLQPEQLILFGLNQEKLAEFESKYPILNGRLAAVPRADDNITEALSSLVVNLPSRYVVLLDQGLILNPQALFIAVKNAVLSQSSMLFSNHLLLRDSLKLASKYIRRSLPGPYDMLSFDHTGGFLCFERDFLEQLLNSERPHITEDKTFFWALSAAAQRSASRVELVPLSLSFEALGSFENRKPSTESVLSLSSELTKAQGLELRTMHSEEIGLLKARGASPVLQPADGTLNIVIPFRDQADDTIKCLKSLLRQILPGKAIVSLVNNNSSPEELAKIEKFVEANFPEPFKVNVVTDSAYFNFARLINVGSRAAESDFILWLNNDVELIDENCIAALLGWMQPPDVGIVGGKLFYPDGSVQSGGIIFSSLGPKNVDSPGEYQDVCREIDGVSFAMALVRRQTFDELGGLDEFVCPNGFGDALFCETARDQGWRTMYVPRATAFHYESKSRKEQVEDQERFELSLAGIETAERYREFHSERRAEEFDILASEPIDRLAAILLNNKPARRFLNIFATPIIELGRFAKNSYFSR
ncbi:MAG: glycosyltransferase [Bdellovibrionales bacterium]|nr:glycosyltransferase [Bdellovibrionales bacterium]